MRTTLDIPASLLREARTLAAREGTTVSALVEQALREVLAAKRRRPSFRLRSASFKGRSLRPEIRGATWERLRDLSYE